MARHHPLLAWQRSHALTIAVYRHTSTWPSHERYGLASQARRAAISVGATIAEGAAREGPREFHRFLRISLGSLAELEYHLQLAGELGYLDSGCLQELMGLHGEALNLLLRLTLSMKRVAN